ncbi:RHS repeat protein [Bradyrhizobium diazoefficiens]|uniref:beta strand repeat-containing protein n=1 Tax=Bradyrhizobium diazoefficiens TaxID=1355477 RepID=UPI00190CC2B5|nr:RHS repeat protein [Bradyrhizobium diazoefficiens]QQO35944.1 RHS repeat protein [Bradyrhizobium diazoefficiens]
MATITSSDQTVLSASAFTSSIGVNTHVSYAWGSYNNLALVEADLKYLGVTTLRDGLTNIPGAQPVLDGLANDGYKFDLGASSSIPATGAAGLQQYIAALDAFEAAHPGSIIALEGLNEVNHQAFSYNGSSTIEAAAQFQQALYSAIKADASLAKFPVYNLTLAYDDPADFAKLGNLGASSDYANSHAYVSTGTTPAAALASALNLASSASSGDPKVITETGYTTLSTTPYLGVNESVQAKSILNTLMDAFKDGVGTTYLYELLDRNSSSSDTDPQSHFGLFYDDGTPKLAATAVHNLTTILNDDGTGSGQPTSPLSYTLSNMPDSGNSLVLGKSNGAYDLVVWAEPKVWDPRTNTEISNPSQTVTVQLDGVHQSIKVYDPTGGTDPIETFTNVSSFTIPVSDHPIIIEIDGVSRAASNPAQATDVTGTAAQIVAELADLSASTALQSITLTDTHVLAVASASTMNYIISHYGNALAAIQGGYSFSVTTSTSSWSETKFFNASGTQTGTQTSNFSNGVITSKSLVNVDSSSDTILYAAGVKTQEVIVSANGAKQTTNYNSDGSISSETDAASDKTVTTTVYTNGLKSKVYVTNADGTHTNTFYGITGQAYTTQIQTTKADGTMTSITQLHADGTTQYTKVLNADGSTTTDLYNSAGQKTSEVRNYADGSRLTTNYDTTGAVTQTVAKAASGASTTTNYSAGVLASVYITSADGTKEAKLYTAGQIASDSVQNTDGSSTMTVYANGVKSKVYATHADGTHTNTFYNITGQAYTTQIQTTKADGTVVTITQLHADGTTQYTKVTNADGGTTTGLYNTAGQRITAVQNYADGSSLTTTYNTSGVATQTVSKAVNGTTTTTNLSAGVQTSVYITSADGTKETKLFAAGVIASDLVQKTDGSSTMTVYVSGVKSKVYVTNADGTHTNTFYNITGQAYTTQIQTTKADGTVTAFTNLHADGTTQYTKITNADGGTTTGLYNTAGQKITEVHNYADGSSLTTTYNTSGVVTRTVAKATNGTTTTTNLSAGVQTSIYITTADGTKETKLFTAGVIASDLVQKTDGSSSMTVFASGVKSKVYVTNADGTHTNTFYNITGQAYTTEIQKTKADGTITAITDLHADGTLQYSKVVNADGSITTDQYDSTGHKTTEVVNYADGSTLTSTYDTAGAVTQTVTKDSGNSTTTNFSSGVKTSVYITNADGSKESDLYTSGHLTSTLIQKTDGSSATTVYSNDIKTATYETHADGTHTNTFFNVTGKAYTTEIQQSKADGTITSITDLHADGSLQYTKVVNSDGSVTTDLYDSTGHKTTEVQNYTDGSTLSSTYDTTGSVTQTVAKANGDTTTTNFSGGVKTSVYIANADGSKDTQTYSSGKIASDYVQNTDGSNATTVYTDGVKAKMYVNNADGTHDNFYFNATNTEHDSYNTAGNLAYVDIQNSDGTHNTSAKVAGITLAGGTGNDIFAAAGVGSTTISFSGGNDTVNGFHAGSATGHDTVAIAKLMAADYSHLQLSQSGADTLIHVTANDTILLKNVVAANVTSGDFLFV